MRVLADTGISHGLIGPREAPRLWDRHVLNCAIAHLAIPAARREPGGRRRRERSRPAGPGSRHRPSRPPPAPRRAAGPPHRVALRDGRRAGPDERHRAHGEGRGAVGPTARSLGHGAGRVQHRPAGRVDPAAARAAGGTLLALKGSRAREELDQGAHGTDPTGCRRCVRAASSGTTCSRNRRPCSPSRSASSSTVGASARVHRAVPAPRDAGATGEGARAVVLAGGQPRPPRPMTVSHGPSPMPLMPTMRTDPHTSLAGAARVGSRPPSAEVLFP